MMWSIVLKEAGTAALVDAINVVRKCGYPPVPVKLHQAKSRYADKVIARKVEWEVCSSVDAKSLPPDMHPLHAAVICSSVHVIDILIRSLSNVQPPHCNPSHTLTCLIMFTQVNIAASALKVLPVHCAAAAGSAKALELLLQVMCIMSHVMTMMSSVLQAGGDARARAVNGRSALHCACVGHDAGVRCSCRDVRWSRVIEGS